jgi:ubiquinone/menaquinone biosynthesis C-methylase UbiE
MEVASSIVLMTYDAKNNWNKHLVEEKTSLLHPSQGLIRLVKGDYPAHQHIKLDGLRVLDIGSGDGRNSEFLRSQGANVSGVEISEDICAVARQRFPHVDFLVGSSKALPFPDGSFDVAVGWNSIYYMNEEVDIILEHFMEAKRVLKSSGRLVLSIPMPSSFIFSKAPTLKGGPNVEYVKITEDPFQMRNGATLAKFVTLESLLELLHESGFERVAVGEEMGDWFGLRYDWWILDCAVSP